MQRRRAGIDRDAMGGGAMAGESLFELGNARASGQPAADQGFGDGPDIGVARPALIPPSSD